jgi:hypothetical protein
MRPRPAKISDIPYIIANIAQPYADEFVAMGLSDEAACALAGYYLGKGPADAGDIDGRPAAKFGCFPDGDRMILWFMATAEYFALGALGVRYAQRYLKALHAGGMGDLWDRPYLGHPEAVRWLRVLGFEPDVDGWWVHRAGGRCTLESCASGGD